MSSESLHVQHGVAIYETPDFLCDRVADYLAEGLRGGESPIVVAIAPREGLLTRRLMERGFDVDSASKSRRFAFFEARATLGRIMVTLKACLRGRYAAHHGTRSDGVRVRVDASSRDHVCVSIHNGGSIPGELTFGVSLPRNVTPRGSTH